MFFSGYLSIFNLIKLQRVWVEDSFSFIIFLLAEKNVHDLHNNLMAKDCTTYRAECIHHI